MTKLYSQGWKNRRNDTVLPETGVTSELQTPPPTVDQHA